MQSPEMDMSNLVKDYVKCEVIYKENEILSEINDGRSKLLDVVECLGSYLTSTEIPERNRSTQLLSSLLHKLPKHGLQQKEVDVLVTFYCDRIKDHHSIQPQVLYGMAALCEYTNLSSTSIQSILRQINKELHIQSLSQKDRRHYYTMVLHLLANRLVDCQAMEADFVYCYMQAMDSEKDPRNLVLGFQCVTTIAQNFPLGVFTEDLFEVVACYFPIDFTPPPNDPHGIKKEDLVLGLKQAMSASAKFAEFCLPLLLEKATSSIPTAKIAAFETLAACSEVYGAFSLKEYLGTLWSAIQREVISPYSTMVENAALEALSAITKTLAVQKGSSIFHGFIKEAFQDTRRHISEPEQKLALPNAKLLDWIAKSSEAACVQVHELLMPVLLGLYPSHTLVHRRRVILEIIVSCVKTVKDYKFKKEVNPLSEYRDSLYPLLVTMLTDRSAQLRAVAITGLVGLLSLQDYLSVTQTTNVAQFLLTVITQDTDQDVRKEAVSALTYLSIEFPAVIKEHILECLITSLQQDHVEVEVGGGENTQSPAHMTHDYILNVIACLTTNTDLVPYTVSVYIEYLKHLHKAEEVSNSAVNKANICCKCLCSIVVNNAKWSTCRDYFSSSLLRECFQLAGCDSVLKDHGGSRKLLCDVEVLRSLASVVRNIVCEMDKQQCDETVNMTVNAFTGKENPLLEKTTFIMSKNNSVHEKKLVVLLSAVISSLPKQVSLPQYSEIEDWLYHLCVEESEAGIHTDAARCVAALFNKYSPDCELEESSSVVGHFYCTYKDKNQSLLIRQKAFEALLWMTKAAVLASHKLQYQLIDMVLQALTDVEFAGLAADGFYIILNEFEGVMSVEMHADVKIMYRQRFFHITMPKLMEGFTQAPAEQKPHYLTALSYLLRFVPKEVLMAELPPILPLLVQTLQLLEQPELWQSTLSTLYDLMHDAPDSFHSHVSDLLPSLLTLTHYKPNMKVRVGATQCVGVLSTLPAHLILPHRQQVLKQLAKPLDDHKRLVRKEAALARAEWFLLGQPGGNK